MLKTNTKKARENVKKYILKYFDPQDYEGYPGEFTGNPENFDDVKNYIIEIFNDEYCKGRQTRETEWERFQGWASGLPSILDCCYYYNRSAVDDLGDILEETPEERARFSERKAEYRLTYIIYRELTR